MALFLSESVGHTVELISIEEALVELHSIAMEGEVLTESLLRADFIIHEQSRELSEEVKVDKNMGFFAKAWEAIKAFARKVWETVKRVCKAIWAKIKAVYARVMGNKDDLRKQPKSKLAVARLKAQQATELALLVERKWESKEAYEKAKSAVETKFQRAIEDAGKLEGKEIITKEEFAKLFGEVDKATKAADKAVDGLQQQVNALESDLKKAQASAANAKEMRMKIVEGKNKEIAALRDQLAGAQKAAAAAAAAAGQLSSIAGATGADAQNPEEDAA